jgi:hypothetical protein
MLLACASLVSYFFDAGNLARGAMTIPLRCVMEAASIDE